MASKVDKEIELIRLKDQMAERRHRRRMDFLEKYEDGLILAVIIAGAIVSSVVTRLLQ